MNLFLLLSKLKSISARNREHRLFDGGRDPSPGNLERRRVENPFEQGGEDRNETSSVRQSPSHGSGVTGEPAAARPPTLQSSRSTITILLFLSKLI